LFKENLLASKKILVTGGGTGLGRVMAEQYLRLGAEVAICGRRMSVLNATCAELREATGGTIKPYQVDIKDYEAVDRMIGQVWADGPLTGLVNNAAGNFISRTEDLSPRGFNAIADIVLHGTFYVTNAVGKRWIRAGLKGNVISIVVTWVFNGGPFTVPSAMAKSGITAMTKSLAVEWGPKGIRLNAIAPGPFPTKGAWERLMPDGVKLVGRADQVPLRRLGRHPELANLAVFLMSDEVEYLTGQIIAIDGGQSLNNTGTFNSLQSLSDADWLSVRDKIKGANEADKSERVR
jgi:NAD(P)-dependent dehydrogenase (short-subunit alcohol dehydrogenase family)